LFKPLFDDMFVAVKVLCWSAHTAVRGSVKCDDLTGSDRSLLRRKKCSNDSDWFCWPRFSLSPSRRIFTRWAVFRPG
jgi:hypothetical protein